MRREFASHLNTAELGWQWSSSWGDAVSIMHAEAYINVHRDEQKHPQPVVIPGPWQSAPEAVEQVTAEERDLLRAELQKRGAFRNLID